MAASLANRMPSDYKQYYLNTAVAQWNWFRNSGLINGENLINDGLDSNCRNNGGPPVSDCDTLSLPTLPVQARLGVKFIGNPLFCPSSNR